MKKIKGLLLFLTELLSRPRSVGAAWPSSRWLARTIAHQVPQDSKGLIIELGGGTGVVTQALLANGVQPQQLVVIEQSKNLADHIQQLFPEITVITGRAQELSQLLGDKASNVSTVVSSLPLRSLRKDHVEEIAQELKRVLPPHGTLIQFTYDWLRPYHILPNYFHLRYIQTVWLNLPPARIGVFTKHE